MPIIIRRRCDGRRKFNGNDTKEGKSAGIRANWETSDAVRTAVSYFHACALYNIVDQIFIGQGIGYLGNAATTIAFPIMTIILAASTLLGAGGSSYAAIKMGEKKEEEAEKTLGNVFLLLVGIGLLILILGYLFMTPMLKVFGATENTMEYARQYTSIILIGAPFNMLGVGLSNMARTDGSPSLSMYSIVIGAVLNTILDPIYIFVFHWGVAGAAIATITSQIISAVVLIVYFVKKGKHMRLNKKCLHFDGMICRNAAALGISSGITDFEHNSSDCTEQFTCLLREQDGCRR